MSNSLSKDLNIDNQNIPSFMQKITNILSKEVVIANKNQSDAQASNNPTLKSIDTNLRINGAKPEINIFKKSGILKLVAKALAILGTTVEKKMNERQSIRPQDPEKFPADFPTSVKPGLTLDFH